MNLINPHESDKALKNEIGVVSNCGEAVKKFVHFFENNKVKKNGEREQDLLLFQYGTYDWLDGKGKAFNFNLTRQFEIPGEDEFLQLSLTLFYNPEDFAEVEACQSWSIDFEQVNEWVKGIEQTAGYKKAINLKPTRIEINLERT